MRHATTVAVLWVWCAAASAADPTPPRIDGPDKIDRDAVAVYTLPAVGQTLIDPPPGLSVVARGKEWFVAGKPGTYTLSGVWVDFDAKRVAFVKKTIVVAGGPDPPPVPPVPPGPNPPNPPGPVQSFRVAIVFEAADTLTAAQNSVIYGRAVEEFLDARTTKDGTARGWRRRDKDAPAEGDTATWNALWSAVKPKVTATPCVAVEVNGTVTIEPLPATPEAAVALFKTYLGEK